MRGPSSTSCAAGRQRRRRKSEPRHYRACRRAAHCPAKLARASSAPCLQSSALDAASILRLADMSLAQAFHTRRPSKNGTTAACHTRLHRAKQALKLWIGQRLPRGARRLACGFRIGPPYLGRLVSACWAASDILNGGFRSKGKYLFRPPKRPQLTPIRRPGQDIRLESQCHLQSRSSGAAQSCSGILRFPSLVICLCRPAR